MPVWRIEPVAGPADPRWMGRRRWREVVVSAPTAAYARIVARSVDAGDSDAVGNESGGGESAFEDEKLYRVAPLEDGAERPYAPESGEIAERAVLYAKPMAPEA